MPECACAVKCAWGSSPGFPAANPDEIVTTRYEYSVDRSACPVHSDEAIEKLRDLIRRLADYIEHRPTCPTLANWKGAACTCGFNDLLAEARKAGGE